VFCGVFFLFLLFLPSPPHNGSIPGMTKSSW
jgi:hypothetical protein